MKRLSKVDIPEKVPAEKRWEITAQTLTHLVTLYSHFIKEEAGLDAHYRISNEVWRELGRSVKTLIRPLKIDCHDAASVHQGVRQFTQIIMGSGLDFEVIEASRQRSVIRIYRCPWHEIMIDTGLQSFCEPHHQVHETFCRSIVSILNPRLSFRFTQHTVTHENPYCEEIVESTSEGIIHP